jgi:predicted small secreted protein
MRKLMMICLAGAAMLAAGCNTVAGAGKDISSAGHAVTQTAKDASH